MTTRRVDSLLLWDSLCQLPPVRTWRECAPLDGGEPFPVGVVSGGSTREADRFAQGYFWLVAAELRHTHEASLLEADLRGSAYQLIRDVARGLTICHFVGCTEKALSNLLVCVQALGEELRAVSQESWIHLFDHVEFACGRVARAVGALTPKEARTLKSNGVGFPAASAFEFARVDRVRQIEILAPVCLLDMHLPEQLYVGVLNTLLGYENINCACLPAPRRKCDICRVERASNVRIAERSVERAAGKERVCPVQRLRKTVHSYRLANPHKRILLKHLCSKCA